VSEGVVDEGSGGVKRTLSQLRSDPSRKDTKSRVFLSSMDCSVMNE
jgi:hypothetical protein